ncbi:MAG TPA: O-antigen ligase family protein [Flavipsychrobacter sp.]|nr:O-antigen ligase family protein [Flavipsychrobacter sp.]
MASSKFPNVYKIVIAIPFIMRIIEESIYHDPIFLGKGFTFWGFFIFLFGTLIYNYGNLIVSFRNRLIYSFAIFLGASCLIEFFHTNSVYREVSTTFFMFAAVPLYASWILKNKESFKYIIISFLAYAFVNALNIIINVSIFKMLAAGSSDLARENVTKGLWFYTNLNGIAYIASISTVICFTVARNIENISQKRLLYILSLMFLYVTALSLSRSAYINLAFICTVMYIKYRPKVKFQYIIPLVIVVLFINIGPVQKLTNLFFGRFEEININQKENVDSRVTVYRRVYKYLPDIYLNGVGEGNYYGKWGEKSDFARLSYDDEGNLAEIKVTPTHNSFTQILFYWGILPLVLYIFLLVRLTKMLPPKYDTSLMAKITTMVYFSTISLIIFSNNFNYKDFTFAYGLLLGLYLRRRYKLSN